MSQYFLSADHASGKLEILTMTSRPAMSITCISFIRKRLCPPATFRTIKEAVPQRMESFIEHMRTSAGAKDLAHFDYLGTDLVQFIGVLPIHEEWVQDVLKCLGIQTSRPHGAVQLNRGRGLFRAATDKQWDQFCRKMWLYTIPDNTYFDVFNTIRRVRVTEDLDDEGLTRLDILEELCRDFNRELGWRCAQYAERLIADARQAPAVMAGQTGRMFVQAQDVVLGVLLSYFDRNAEFQVELQRMGKRTYQYKKCAMALRSPDDEIPDVLEGDVDWFFKLWDVLEDKAQGQFRRAMAAKLNGRGMCVVDGVSTCDFYVNVNRHPRGMAGRKGPRRGVPVVFYLQAGLEELTVNTFNVIVHATGHHESVLKQFIEQLEEPHQEYADFRAKAYDLPEDRGNPLLQRLVQTRVGAAAADAGGLRALLQRLGAPSSVTTGNV